MITSWDDSDRAIRAEHEADTCETMRDACTLCGDRLTGEVDEFDTIEGEHHRAHSACSEAWEAIMGDVNAMDVPEIRHFHREAIAGGTTLISYQQRDPGARDWEPVRLFRVAEPV